MRDVAVSSESLRRRWTGCFRASSSRQGRDVYVSLRSVFFRFQNVVWSACRLRRARACVGAACVPYMCGFEMHAWLRGRKGTLVPADVACSPIE